MNNILRERTEDAEAARKAADAAGAKEYIPYDEKYVKKEKQRKWQDKLNAEKAPKSNKSMADKHADTEKGKRIAKAFGRKGAEAARKAADAAAGAAKAAGSAAVSVKNESRNRSIIRMTESDLHQIIKESVNRILNEVKLGNGTSVHGWYPGADGKFNAARDFNVVGMTAQQTPSHANQQAYKSAKELAKAHTKENGLDYNTLHYGKGIGDKEAAAKERNEYNQIHNASVNKYNQMIDNERATGGKFGNQAKQYPLAKM
jgi:hypothetical protein